MSVIPPKHSEVYTHFIQSVNCTRFVPHLIWDCMAALFVNRRFGALSGALTNALVGDRNAKSRWRNIVHPSSRLFCTGLQLSTGASLILKNDNHESA